MPPRLALPEVVALDLVEVAAGARQAPHRHDHHEIHWLRRGRGTLACGDREIAIGPGAVYLFLPGEAHGGGTGGERAEVLYLGVRFPPTVAVTRDRTDLPFFLTGPAAAAVATPMAELAAILEARSDRARIPDAAVGPVLAVIAALVEPVRVLAAGSRRQRALADDALALLDGWRGPAPSLRALAARIGVTSGHLGEALGVVTGRTFPELIAQQRVRAARALLTDGDLPVRAIARRVGLSGPRALARLFRRVTGRPPSAFRR